MDTAEIEPRKDPEEAINEMSPLVIRLNLPVYIGKTLPPPTPAPRGGPSRCGARASALLLLALDQQTAVVSSGDAAIAVSLTRRGDGGVEGMYRAWYVCEN